MSSARQDPNCPHCKRKDTMIFETMLKYGAKERHLKIIMEELAKAKAEIHYLRKMKGFLPHPYMIKES